MRNLVPVWRIAKRLASKGLNKKKISYSGCNHYKPSTLSNIYTSEEIRENFRNNCKKLLTVWVFSPIFQIFIGIFQIYDRITVSFAKHCDDQSHIFLQVVVACMFF